MPFKSKKQRKWMHANKPKMAKKWEKEEESVNESSYHQKQIIDFIKKNKQAVEDDPSNMPRIKLFGVKGDTNYLNISLGALSKLAKIMVKESVNEAEVTLPAGVRRFMSKFIAALKGSNLNRKRQIAVLGGVVDSMGIDPSKLMQIITKIKRGMNVDEAKKKVYESITWKNRKFGERLPTLADYKKLKEDSLNEAPDYDLYKKLNKVDDQIIKLLMQYTAKADVGAVAGVWMDHLHKKLKKVGIKL